MKTAKAAVMTGIDKPFEIREFELTSPPAGMAKIELIASGICGTDIHIHRGKIPVNTPAIIGHEFIGRIEEISEEDRLMYDIQPGDNVIVDIACPCGECLLCNEGDDANCIHMGVTNGGNPEVAPHLYGGFAEYNYSPVKNLIKIPAELDPKMTCVFACAGPTVTHALHLGEEANCHIERSNVAVVQGLGPIGMFAVIKLATMGIKNIVAITAGNNAVREALALKLGATEVLNIERMGIQDIIKHVKNLNNGIGVDLVFEASGSIKAVAQGMEMLRNRGVYLVPGQYSNSGKVEISPQLITFHALRIIGSSQYSVHDVKNYLDFLMANPNLHESITALSKSYTVPEINSALEDAKTGLNIKTMLVK